MALRGHWEMNYSRIKNSQMSAVLVPARSLCFQKTRVNGEPQGELEEPGFGGGGGRVSVVMRIDSGEEKQRHAGWGQTFVASKENVSLSGRNWAGKRVWPRHLGGRQGPQPPGGRPQDLYLIRTEHRDLGLCYCFPGNQFNMSYK